MHRTHMHTSSKVTTPSRKLPGHRDIPSVLRGSLPCSISAMSAPLLTSSVTIHRGSGDTVAPRNSTMFGCLSLRITVISWMNSSLSDTLVCSILMATGEPYNDPAYTTPKPPRPNYQMKDEETKR